MEIFSTEGNCSCEPGIVIKKSLKGMKLNDPEVFGLVPLEKHTSISINPIIGCHCTNCQLSKFSLVETQACKCKDTCNQPMFYIPKQKEDKEDYNEEDEDDTSPNEESQSIVQTGDYDKYRTEPRKEKSIKILKDNETVEKVKTIEEDGMKESGDKKKKKKLCGSCFRRKKNKI